MTDPSPRDQLIKDIQETLALENLMLRNLKVTQGYRQLAKGMKRVIGDEKAGARLPPIPPKPQGIRSGRRSCLQNQQLFTSPFLETQNKALLDGKIIQGKL